MPIVSETYSTGAQFRVTVLGEFNSASAVQNVYEVMMKTGSGVSGADVLDDLVEYFDDLCVLVKAFLSALVVLRGIRVQELDGANTTGELLFAAPIVGGAVSDPTAPGVAVLVNFYTGVAHRNLKKYWGPLGEGAIDSDGVLAASGLGLAGVAADWLLNPHAMTNETWQYSHNAGGTIGVLHPVSAALPVAPSYQRRRKQGVGI